MSRAWVIVLGVIIVASLQAAAVALALYFSYTQVQKSEHAWCTIIHLSLAGQKPQQLTQKQRIAYNAIVQLGEQYNCLKG